MRLPAYALLLAAFPALAAAQSDSHWFMAQTDKAAVVSVSSTGELVETQFGGDYLYPPAYVLDGKGGTTWCPGGRGVGQSLTIVLADPVSFDEIQIRNGFSGPNDLYAKNNRVKTVEIAQVAGQHFQNKSYELADGQADWQSIAFPLDQTAKSLNFTIKEVYRGYKYDDTCISDIRLLYKGKPIPWVGADKLIALQTKQSKAMLGANSEKDFRQYYIDCLLVNDDGDCFYFSLAGDNGAWVSQGRWLAKDALLETADEWRYTLSKNRIVTEQTVGYVTTKVAMAFVPDGPRGVAINGVYYRRADKPAGFRIEP